MFLHVSVSHSVHGGGASKPTPRGEVESLAGGCLGLYPGGKLMGLARGVSSPPRQTPPPKQTTTTAGGTHPTGIHSCFCIAT